MLRFGDLGASCFGLRFRVLRFRNYRILPMVRSLQSAVRSLRFTLTAIEITGHCIPLPDKVNRMNAPLSILGHFIYTLNLNEE